MPTNPFRRKQRVTSLTIEEDALRYVELRSTEPLLIERAEDRMLPEGVISEGKVLDPRAVEEAVEGAVRDWGLRRKRVRFLAPDQFVIIRKVETPADVPEDELKGYFFIEIGSSLYLPFDDPLFDVVPYVSEDNRKESIIIASKEEVVRQYEQVLDDAKLNPVECDIAPLALYRLAYHQHDLELRRNVLIADFLGSELTVSIFHRHHPLFMRPIELLEEEWSAEGAFREISKLINFYTYNMMEGSETIDCLFISGTCGMTDELVKLFNVQMNLDAGSIRSRRIEDVAGREVPAHFDRVIGLALKEV